MDSTTTLSILFAGIALIISVATMLFTWKAVVQSTNAINEQKKAIEEQKKSRMVSFVADIVGLLQTHTVKKMEQKKIEKESDQEYMDESIDSLYLNPLELFAYCINNNYIEDDLTEGYFLPIFKDDKNHLIKKYCNGEYPEIEKLLENISKNLESKIKHV